MIATIKIVTIIIMIATFWEALNNRLYTNIYKLQGYCESKVSLS